MQTNRTKVYVLYFYEEDDDHKNIWGVTTSEDKAKQWEAGYRSGYEVFYLDELT